MKLENLEETTNLKKNLDNHDGILDILLTSDYCVLTIEDEKNSREAQAVILAEKGGSKRIYSKDRDILINELKELGIEV